MNFWFKPKRFWGFFAAYYPSSWQGWLVASALTLLLALISLLIANRSQSFSDTLIGVTPFALVIFLIFDIVCIRKGEYPSWWRPRN